MKPRRSKGKRKKGRDYEKAAVRYLSDQYPGQFVPHPWIVLQDAWGRRWVQPDGLLVRPLVGIITIVEFKLKHTPAAWFQLEELYRPVVEFLFPKDLWTIRTAEVCRWYDGTVFFPGPHKLCARLEEVQKDSIGVHIWCP